MMAIKYQPGDTIIKFRPLCQALLFERKEHYCDMCLGHGSTLKRCGKCRQMSYCGKTCQAEDWKAGHKYECDIYAKCNPDLIKDVAVRFLLRLYLRVTKDGIDTKTFQLHDGRERSLIDLVSHEDDQRKSSQWPVIMIVVKVVTQLLGSNADENLLFRLLCQHVVNGIGLELDVGVEDSQAAGFILCIEMSIFDHRCDANAYVVFRGNEIEIRAMKTIADGEEVFLNYNINLEDPKDVRQERMKTNYFFTCRCRLCESNIDQLVDRERMKYLKQQEKVKMDMGQYKEAYDFAIERLAMFRQLYGEFHPNQTRLLRTLVKVGLMAKVHAEKQFQELVDNLQKCVKVTMRKDGDRYERSNMLVEMARLMPDLSPMELERIAPMLSNILNSI